MAQGIINGLDRKKTAGKFESYKIRGNGIVD